MLFFLGLVMNQIDDGNSSEFHGPVLYQIEAGPVMLVFDPGMS